MGKWINIYQDGESWFTGDYLHNSYEEARDARDNLTTYRETVEVSEELLQQMQAAMWLQWAEAEVERLEKIPVTDRVTGQEHFHAAALRDAINYTKQHYKEK